MRRFPLLMIFVLLCCLSSRTGFCQEEGAAINFTYGFSGCGNITGVPGSDYNKTVDCVLSTSDNSSEIGVESWSFCVEASNTSILSITIDGTDAVDLMDDGWEINEVVDNGNGAISAAILSFRNTGTLPPDGVVSVATITLEGNIPENEDRTVGLGFVDGLRGSGRPVDSIVTLDGETMMPRLGSCSFIIAPDRLPPATPAGLVASAGDGIVNLGWTANNEDDLSGYNLYRDNAILASGLLENNYTDPEVENGSTYSYSVTAVDTSGNESGPSVPVEATPIDETPPAPPTGLSARAGNGAITLDWADNAEDDLAGYNIYRDGMLLAAGLDESSYNDTGLENGRAYTYTVTAVDTQDNESASSEELQAAPELPPVGPFLRGDANVDLRVDIADAIWMLGYLFAGGVMPQCNAAADSNADGEVNVADPIFTLNWLFMGGLPSPSPTSCEMSSNPGDIRQGCDQPACDL